MYISNCNKNEKEEIMISTYNEIFFSLKRNCVTWHNMSKPQEQNVKKKEVSYQRTEVVKLFNTRTRKIPARESGEENCYVCT